MFGFAFGFACLFGMFHIIRRSRRGHWGGNFGDFGRHGGRRGGRRGMRYGMLRKLFDRLDTTARQERVISDAVDEVMDAAGTMRDEVWGARSQVGKAFRSDTLDAEMLGDILSQHDDALNGIRATFAGALARVHEALDAEQRERLSQWLEQRSRWRGGPYRRASC